MPKGSRTSQEQGAMKGELMQLELSKITVPDIQIRRHSDSETIEALKGQNRTKVGLKQRRAVLLIDPSKGKIEPRWD